MFSGGIGSWACARRVVEKFGAGDVTLLHTDTRSEHPELYRFLRDAAEDVGAPLVEVADGRTIWQVFRDERFLGNSRIAPCTSKLKQAVRDRWLRDNCDPADTVCYVGIDWTEEHRFIGHPDWTPGSKLNPGLRRSMAAKGWRFEAPMCNGAPMAKWQMKEWAISRGLRLSESYNIGLSHDNCGGGCVKAGVGHWAALWAVRPAWYLQCEAEEESLRGMLGDVTILTETVRGVTHGVTLRELRRRMECGGERVDMFAVGGCGCGVDEENYESRA